jgi:SAM-dependent methyltransferase
VEQVRLVLRPVDLHAPSGVGVSPESENFPESEEAVRSMKRSLKSELMDDPTLPEETLALVYRDLLWTHRVLGNVRALLLELGRVNKPLRHILDIGCGRGELLLEIQRRIEVEVVGVELRLPAGLPWEVKIVQADAVVDSLPACDVALAVCVVHHLSDEAVVELIRNVGRSCSRLLILDLVRHPLPLILFRCFLAPFVHRINALDGISSIRRSYTPRELEALVCRALQGSGATYRQSVSWLNIRQIVDICYR